MKKIVLLIIITFSVLSCRKDDASSTLSSPIVGNWNYSTITGTILVSGTNVNTSGNVSGTLKLNSDNTFQSNLAGGSITVSLSGGAQTLPLIPTNSSGTYI